MALLTDLCGVPGGIQTFNRSMVKALEDIAGEQGWAVTLLVLNDRPHAGTIENYLDVTRTRYLAFGRRKWRFAVAALRAACSRATIILGHLNFVSLASLMRLLCRRSGILLVVYGIDVERDLSSVETWSLRQVDQILSISAFTRHQMVARHSLEDGRFEVVPALPEPRYGGSVRQWSRSELSLPTGSMILTVARLDASDRYKNIDLVIEAISTVARAITDVFYVVVGDGTDRTRLMSFARNIGVADRVHFAGRVSGEFLAAFYQTCDVFVLPSTREGLGIVLLEAMYYSKPCVGVRAGAIPEVIDDGTTGLLTEPGDPQALAAALVGLLTNENLRGAMGRAGRERFEAEFSFPRFRERLRRILCA